MAAEGQPAQPGVAFLTFIHLLRLDDAMLLMTMTMRTMRMMTLLMLMIMLVMVL
jgi:hypothetical protein